MLELRENLVGLGWRSGQIWLLDAGYRSFLADKPGQHGKRCSCDGAHRGPRTAMACLLDRMNMPGKDD